MERGTVLAEVERRRAAGVAATAHARPTEAQEHLDVALDLLDGQAGPARDAARVRVLLSLALCRFDLDGLEAAERVLDDAEEDAAALPDEHDGPRLRGLCHSQRANVLGRSGRLAEAETALDRAAAHLASLDPRDRWVVLLNRGLARSHRGDLEGATTDLLAARDAAGGAGLTGEQALAQHDSGWVSFLRGDLPDALEQMDRAARDALVADDPMTSLDRGRVLLEAGLVDEATAVLGEAAAAAARRRAGQTRLEAVYEQARAALVAGRDEEVVPLCRQVETLAHERDAAAWAARAAVLRLRATLRATADLPTAAGDGAGTGPVSACAAEAEWLATAPGPDVVVGRAARLVQAEAWAVAGDDVGARAVLDRAGGDADDALTPQLGLRLEDARVRARVAALRGDRTEASRRLRAAAADLAAGAAVSSLDLRTARSVHGAALARLDVAVAFDTGPLAVLDATERWRAAGSRWGGVRPHPSPEVADALARVRRLGEEVRAEGATDERLAALVTAEREAAAAARRAAGAGPASARPGGGSTSAPGTSPDRVVADLVDAGADLLTTLEHDRAVWAVAVVGGQPVLRRLGDATAVDEAARRVARDVGVLGRLDVGPMAEVVRSSLEAGLAQLRSSLVDPVLPGGAAAERVVVVPHGVLRSLPWSLLLPGRAVTVASSATAWSAGLSREQAGPPRVGVVAGPRLVHADAEADAVRGAWSGAGAVGRSGDDLRGLLADADLVHVAAHGRHHQQNPMFSSVDLDDGPLALYDVEASGVAAGHVVLAACDAGRALVRPGEEPLGLAAGLLALGARSVVAAGCAVPDDVTAALMPRYHAALASGAPSDVALRDALVGQPLLAGAFVVAGSPWSVRAHGG